MYHPYPVDHSEGLDNMSLLYHYHLDLTLVHSPLEDIHPTLEQEAGFGVHES